MSKREEMREKRHKKEVTQRTLLIILVVVAALIIAGVLIYPSLAPIGAITTVAPQTRPNEKGLSFGPDNAPVKVIEFADFQCPACKYYEDNLASTMVSKYAASGKVQVTFVPDSVIKGTESINAAQAAYCANDQGKFWQYHDILYANQASENSGIYSDRRLVAYAQSIGLDLNQFNGCYNSHKYQQQVQDDLTLAANKKVDRTPTFIVNDKNVFADTLFQTIDDAIKAIPPK
jgi:protein-disulfide isomerase